MLTLQTVATAVRAMATNRLRTILTVLGILVGVGSVILLISYSAGVRREMLARFDRRGATTLGMGIAQWKDDVPDNEEITEADAEAIRRDCWTIEYASLLIPGLDETMAFGVREREGCEVIAADHYIFNTRPNSFAAGSPFTESDNALRARVCVLGWDVYSELFFNEPAVGEQVTLFGRPFTVVGVLAELGGRPWESTDDLVIIPLRTLAESQVEAEWTRAELLMKVEQFELMPYAEQQVREYIHLRHPRVPVPVSEAADGEPWEFDESQHVWAWSVHDWRERRQQTADSLGRFLIVMGALALLIGGVGVMNIMLVSVEERTPEIGLRKALGASSANVLGQFLIEAVGICAVGGVLGTAGAVLACRYMERLPSELAVPDPIITPAAITVAIVVTFTSGLIAGMYPAWRASQLDPIEALRHE
jgi:putative ABC transport system permease protein